MTKDDFEKLITTLAPMVAQAMAGSSADEGKPGREAENETSIGSVLGVRSTAYRVDAGPKLGEYGVKFLLWTSLGSYALYLTEADIEFLKQALGTAAYDLGKFIEQIEYEAAGPEVSSSLGEA